MAQPAFTFHLKTSTQVDLPAHAVLIVEENERRAVLAAILQKLGRMEEDVKR